MTDQRLILVCPPGNRKYERAELMRKELGALAKQEGWETETFRTSEVGTRQLVLGGLEAENLYRLLHRCDAAVVQVGAPARVLLNPAQRAMRENTIPLEKFICGKAAFGVVNGRCGPADALRGLVESRAILGCTGERDPRCLPMFVFDPWCECEDLTPGATKKFEAAHGPPRRRVDDKNRAWEPSVRAAHGREALTVCGYHLRPGFHWDVQASRNQSELSTVSEIWKLPGSSYVNVYPDAYVRGGQSGSDTAKRVFRSRRS